MSKMLRSLVVPLALAGANGQSSSDVAKHPPNLIYIMADDYGWANVGFHNKDMLTPNIDSLATTEGFEVSRMYAYRFCSPSRASLMSGRLPYHVNQNNNAEWGWDSTPIHPRMKLLPEKLQEAGYYTVQVGKWHLGLAKQSYTPAGRGFNESLTMLMGSEDHLTQRNGNGHHVDLWATDRPAFGLNGTYSAELFGDYAVQSILDHHTKRPAMPLFMYLAFTVTHAPIQAPKRFEDLYPSSWVAGRRTYAAMASALDEAVGNVTATLKATGMWKNTLVVFTSDNGGPSLVGGPSYANNYPLRGGKGNAFEGGVRVAAAVSGGYLPASQFGRVLPATGHVHFADMYQTFCHVSGHLDCSREQPGGGVPATDSHNMWKLFSGHTDDSPRTETVLEYREVNAKTGMRDAALLSGDWKFVVGKQSGTGYWWGPSYPNSTEKLPMDAPGCPNGCLFNISADPSEHVDLSGHFPNVASRLGKRLDTLGETVFQSDSDGSMNLEAAQDAAADADWWCPWLDHTESLVV